VRGEVWSELSGTGGSFTNTKPMISSIRRNLQREHVDRLIALATGLYWPNASANTIKTLARRELELVHALLDATAERSVDDYSRAHLDDLHERIERALDAHYWQTK
jgi:hypothetical protein